MVVVRFEHELRVVELLLLGNHREPEPRSSATDERGDRLEDRTRCGLARVIHGVLVERRPDDGVDLAYRLVRLADGSVLGQPDVDVGEIGEVVREERVLQPAREREGDPEKHDRRAEDDPPAADRGADDAPVEAPEALRASLVDGGLRLLRRAKEVVAEQRCERVRDEQRPDQ
jgi:hypothetical protein